MHVTQERIVAGAAPTARGRRLVAAGVSLSLPSNAP